MNNVIDNINESNIDIIASNITNAFISVHSEEFKGISRNAFMDTYLNLLSENIEELKIRKIAAQRQEMSNSNNYDDSSSKLGPRLGSI